MNWQPIETAPRDGTAVLLYGGRWYGEVGAEGAGGVRDAPVAVCWWNGSWRLCDTDYYAVTITNPTHWMPLPEPPKEGE